MTETNPPRAAARRIADECLAYSTRRLGRAITRLYNDELKEAGLNVAEMNLLVAVAASSPIQPSRLAAALEMEKSTLSRNAKRLVERGWLISRRNEEGRGELLSLTKAGANVLEQSIPYWQKAQDRASALVQTYTVPTSG